MRLASNRIIVITPILGGMGHGLSAHWEVGDARHVSGSLEGAHLPMGILSLSILSSPITGELGGERLLN